MTRLAFMVLVDPDDSSWVVTCEHCGEDLTADYSPAPLKITFDPANDPELVARRLQAFELCRSTRRAILLDTDLKPEWATELVLQHVLHQHTLVCGKPREQTEG